MSRHLARQRFTTLWRETSAHAHDVMGRLEVWCDVERRAYETRQLDRGHEPYEGDR